MNPLLTILLFGARLRSAGYDFTEERAAHGPNRVFLSITRAESSGPAFAVVSISNAGNNLSATMLVSGAWIHRRIYTSNSETEADATLDQVMQDVEACFGLGLMERGLPLEGQTRFERVLEEDRII